MLYPLSYRGGAASHQRAAVRTISVCSDEDRRHPTDLALVELAPSARSSSWRPRRSVVPAAWLEAL